MTNAANPIGIFAGARSLLEYHAFLQYVVTRLNRAATGEPKEWKSRGEEFFRVVVRAKYGTSDPVKQRALEAQGLGKDQSKPFHVLTCIDEIAKSEQYSWMRSHYDFLCDYVHHNLSSQSVSTVGGTVAEEVRSAKGKLIFKTPTPVIRYQYPSAIQTCYAIEQTASRAALNMKGAFDCLNTCPESPFTPLELQQSTGTPLGLVGLRQKVGRNDACPCGSGEKFKKCHGR
jgi:hypothetical protein